MPSWSAETHWCRQLVDGIRQLGAEGVVIVGMQMRVREQDCPAAAGRHDHSVEATNRHRHRQVCPRRTSSCQPSPDGHAARPAEPPGGQDLDETMLIGESADHVHGRAMHRLAGKSLGAPVHRIPRADNIEQLAEVIGKQDIRFATEFVDRGADRLSAWLAAQWPCFK